MPINLIASVCNYKNKLAIGSNGKLLFHFREDIQFFKNITTNSLGDKSDCPNIVLMGRKTYESLPNGKLPNRINFVLTNNKKLHTFLHIPSKDLDINRIYYTDLDGFCKFYDNNGRIPKIFVIGGENVYNAFLHENAYFRTNKLYITHVERNDGKMIKFDKDNEPDTFMSHFSDGYKLTGYSEQYTNGEYKARTLYYTDGLNKTSEEHKYLDLMKKILKDGNVRTDRTGTGTISLFGTSLRFDISSSIPLLTTKQVPFKMVIRELLWIMQGHTDAKILQRQGVHIWDGNTSREFLDSRGLQHYPEGVLGAGYGWQLRHHGAKYNSDFAEITPTYKPYGGFDQLQYVEDLLKNDPFSRRIMFSYWNPSDFDKMALVPCHTHCQFYVTEINGQRYLSCQYAMRSNDAFLACGSWNLMFYTVLTYILAKRHNMLPKEIIYTCGDCHIYNNHIEQVKEQLTRTPRPSPKLNLDGSLIDKKWEEMSVDDFDLIGYFPAGKISATMAI
jgi:thymidylate synthase